jgi:hypothetical protein
VPGIDKDSLSVLKDSKGGKEVHFALVAKTAALGQLLANKSGKVDSRKIIDAKLACNKATTHITGTCQGGEDALIFKTAKKVDATAESLTRKLTRENGLGQCEFETNAEAEVELKKPENVAQNVENPDAKKPTAPFASTKPTPDATRPDAKSVIGGNVREQVAKFVKQRTELLKFSKQYLQTMTEFKTKAETQAGKVMPLVQQVDKLDEGEKSRELVDSLQGELVVCDDLLVAAQDAYSTNGKVVATGRGVNAGAFIEDLELAKSTSEKYRQIFLEVADVTQKATDAKHHIELILGEATREINLAISRANTGQIDLQILIDYLDNNVETANSQINKLEKAYDLKAPIGVLTTDLNDTKRTKEQLRSSLDGMRENVSNKQRVMNEVYPRIAGLCKTALARLKQGPQDNAEIKARLDHIKEVLTKATQFKRHFAGDLETFNSLATKIEAKINS